MSEMNVRDMVRDWLEDSEFDGLYNDCGCGCVLGDLMPCDGDQSTCEPAYVFDCWRCAWGGVCGKRGEGCEWMTSTDKDFCEPDYMVAAPASASASQSAALPACASLTVGEVVHVVGYPDWHAQGGIGEAPEGALKAEPGEVFIPIADVAEVIAKAIKDSAPKPRPAALAMPLPAKEVCQNTAKTDDGIPWYPDVETALRHAKKSHLQLGA